MQKPTPVVPSSGALSPASMAEVHLQGGFWGHLQELNRTATIPHEIEWLEKYGTLGNFDAVLNGTIVDTQVGRQFIDSDVYKVLEAIAWETGRTDNSPLEEAAADLLARVLPIVNADGYVNTRFGNPGQAPRYSDMDWGHELYTFGHLIQAGVARLRTGHESSDPLVALSLGVADHVCDTFGDDGLQLVCGHPEIEVALAELYRATGDEKYLKQASIFIDRRGHRTLGNIEFGHSYFQDDTPVREIEVMHGHAVRALYLAAGAIDVAVETQDEDLLAKVRTQYLNTLARRTYITGGMGSHHQDEAFGEDFELPSDRAYCETCAGIASVMVAWRLLLATGDIGLGDIIERTLYNVVATCVSEEGTAFFYANPLHQRAESSLVDPEAVSLRAGSSQRAAWFEVPCCPPNYSRTIAQLGSYAATSNAEGVQLIQYMQGSVEIGEIALEVQTDYPRGSDITVTVVRAPQDWKLTLRIPAWAEGATLSVNGEIRTVAAPAAIVSNLQAGDQVVLDLPLTPRYIHSDPRVDGIRGCVAVESGPLVYCVESALQPEKTDVADIFVDPSNPLRLEQDRITTQGGIATHTEETDWPYSKSSVSPTIRSSEVVFGPYCSWANNGPTTMRVWVPTVKLDRTD